MTRRILVVDDDRAMVRTLCDVLRLRGWDSRGAHSAEEALELERQNDYPVVLMDIKMPGMDGVTAFRVMKARNPDLRVILMTAHSGTDAMQEAEREGAWRVVRKPLEIATLMSLLE